MKLLLLALVLSASSALWAQEYLSPETGNFGFLVFSKYEVRVQQVLLGDYYFQSFRDYRIFTFVLPSFKPEWQVFITESGDGYRVYASKAVKQIYSTNPLDSLAVEKWQARFPVDLFQEIDSVFIDALSNTHYTKPADVLDGMGYHFSARKEVKPGWRVPMFGTAVSPKDSSAIGHLVNISKALFSFAAGKESDREAAISAIRDHVRQYWRFRN